MISIGLTGWGDHESLYSDKQAAKQKLRTYSRHFSVVEVDSSFYAMQPTRNYHKWIEETPADFSFVVKAYQGMTGHMRGDIPFTDAEEMFTVFKQSIVPLQEAGKLRMVLFQYPPWFDCQKKHVELLRYTKERMNDISCSIEFRNQSWFEPQMCDRTLAFLEQGKWIHTICDEPQAGVGSVPVVLQATSREAALIRLHGRNIHGWSNTGLPNWRAVRCLYRYNQEELLEWAERLRWLQEQTKQVYVLFNNNSGGDAADNAKQLMKLLGVEEPQKDSEQMRLFD